MKRIGGMFAIITPALIVGAIAERMKFPAIMLFIALPNFAVWMQNTQIRTAGEAVLNGMQLARAEAISQLRRGEPAGFQVVAEGV